MPNTFKLHNVKVNDFRRYEDGTCQVFDTLEAASAAASLLNGGGSKLFIVRPGTPATDNVPFFGAIAGKGALVEAHRRFARGQAAKK